MKNYILVDFMNMAHRCKNTVMHDDIDMKIGLAMHTIFNSIKKVDNKFKADHVVICCEGNSWRKKAYTGYKKNRVLKELQKPLDEQEDNKLFLEAISEMEEFFATRTRATVLKAPAAEGDDMIALFIDSHPDDHHTIISSDTDFIQLLAKNVDIYNGMDDVLITINGIFDSDGKRVIDHKTGLPKDIPDPEYALFLKCIRGDKSDNIMSAYPGAREKGTKNKIGIKDAYEDRHAKGFNWNNFMRTTWIDEEGNEKVVLERYEFNKHLIDLRKQPQNIISECEEHMANSLAKEPIRNVGCNLLKFCEKWDLKQISKFPNAYADILNRGYML